MLCIVINLERAEARRRAMARQLSNLDLDVSWLVATDWRNLNDESWRIVDRETRRREGRRPLPPGAVACAISHRRAWKRIAEMKSDDLAVILEDDVILSDAFMKSCGLLRQIRSQFDVVFLHKATRRPYVPAFPIGHDRTLGFVRFSDHGALAYALTPRSARRLISQFPRIVHHVDHTLHAHWTHPLSVYVLGPPVVRPADAESSPSFRAEGGGRQRRSLGTTLRRPASILAEEFRKRVWFARRLSAVPNGTAEAIKPESEY